MEFPSSPLAWFWARALNLANILEAMLGAALTMFQSLPPPGLAVSVSLTSGATTTHSKQTESNDHLEINHGGSLGATGLLVDPSLPGVASCQAFYQNCLICPSITCHTTRDSTILLLLCDICEKHHSDSIKYK